MSTIEIDGARWSVERRHELTQVRASGAPPGRRLLLIFENERGRVVRAVVPDDFPADADDTMLAEVWRAARG